MLGIAAAAPSKMPVERLKIAATNGYEFNNIEWRENGRTTFLRP
jgi:hypothetical protein